jgi:CRP-like cAMP-binding protein
MSAKATNPLQADILGLGQQSLERRSLARNEVLFRQGDKVTAIYFVEAALFADIYHCDAVATEPSQVRVYPKEAGQTTT